MKLIRLLLDLFFFYEVYMIYTVFWEFLSSGELLLSY